MGNVGVGRNNGIPQGSHADHRQFLITEAHALLSRLRQVRSFGLTMPMVTAANISPEARRAIHDLLKEGVHEMKHRVYAFVARLQQQPANSAALAQKDFALLKLHFNWLLDRMDIFADVLTQRGEHDTGVRLAGMDVLAEDSIRLNGEYYKPPPLVTYLDRGHGAAIRRARTRLPGGKTNPVAVIRVPRERMISTGIASSLIHEVGHQGADLLGLNASLREELRQKAISDSANRTLWNWYERWISEILSDFWSVASIGIGATTGLMNVVSVPSYFVFRLNPDDPHPPPWIRVRLSIAFGAALYPDAQWARLKRLWDKLYPVSLAGGEKSHIYRQLETLLPAFTGMVTHHRPAALREKLLKDAFPLTARQPAQLRKLYLLWSRAPELLRKKQPSLVFAVIGQARADNLISPDKENEVLSELLSAWALRRSIS
jgi:hypothetical protein